jgi:hypothetical protein
MSFSVSCLCLLRSSCFYSLVYGHIRPSTEEMCNFIISIFLLKSYLYWHIVCSRGHKESGTWHQPAGGRLRGVFLSSPFQRGGDGHWWQACWCIVLWYLGTTESQTFAGVPWGFGESNTQCSRRMRNSSATPSQGKQYHPCTFYFVSP